MNLLNEKVQRKGTQHFSESPTNIKLCKRFIISNYVKREQTIRQKAQYHYKMTIYKRFFLYI